MNPADYGMTWQEVAEKRLEYIGRLEKRLEYIRRLEKDVDELTRQRKGLATETTQLNLYIMQLHGLLEDEGVILTDEFNAKADEIFNGGGEQE